MLCRNREVFPHTHTHQSVLESKRCYGLIKDQTPPPPPVTIQPTPVVEPVTQRQLDYIKVLNGDPVYAAKLTKGDASDYIRQLQRQPRPAPAKKPVDPRMAIIEGMLGDIPDGYYAVSHEGPGGHYDFVRISHPTKGKYKGTLKVQTQHSDLWKEAIIQWPSGQWSIYKREAVDMLMLVIADYKKAAKRYSIELQSCCCCGKTLTDDYSRHYLIGPICDQKHGWEWVKEEVDDKNDGYSYDQLVAMGRPTRVWQDSVV